MVGRTVTLSGVVVVVPPATLIVGYDCVMMTLVTLVDGGGVAPSLVQDGGASESTVLLRLEPSSVRRVSFFFLCDDVDRADVLCFFTVEGRDGEGAGVMIKQSTVEKG